MSTEISGFWARTDTGLVRSRNEDAFVWLGPNETGNFGYLWAVADGMGGEARGDVASRIVVRTLQQEYPGFVQRSGDPGKALLAVAELAHDRIRHAATENPSLEGTGSTLVALAIHRGRGYRFHVGDSRLYGLANDELRQLTRDHTKAELLVDRGELDRDAVDGHPASSVLRLVMGREPFRPESPSSFDATLHDAWLLCSDGLHGFVSEQWIHEALRRLRARHASESLVELARRAESDDNITAIVVRRTEPAARLLTQPDSFLEWSSGDTADLPSGDRTLLLETGETSPDAALPPHCSIDAAGVSTQDLENARTEALDTGPLSRESAGAEAPASAPGDGTSGGEGSTVLFSPDQMAEIRAAAERESAGESKSRSQGEPADSDSSTESTQPDPAAGTMLFSPSEMDEIIAAADAAGAEKSDKSPKASSAAGSTASSASAKSMDGTILFSPDDMEALRSAGEPSKPAAGGGTGAASAAKGADPPKRERTVAMTDPVAERRAERKAVNRQATVAMDASEIDALSEAGTASGASGSRRTIVYVALFAAALVLVGVAAFLLTRRAVAPTQEGGEDTSIAAVTDVGVEEVAAEPEPEPLPVLPPAPAPEPRAPDGEHEEDGMPYYRVAVEPGDAELGERVLRVDAHEVTVEQMTAMRGRYDDMDFVYRASSAPLYAYLPCRGVEPSEAEAHPNVPVCAAPEATEAYCNAVGRRLPTPEDWRAILERSKPAIVAGRGQIWQFRSDGAPPAVPDEIRGIEGVHDGLPEILRGTREQIADGDLPVLAPEGDEPISTKEGLLTGLRARTIEFDELPMLGFRCVSDEPRARRSVTRRAPRRRPATDRAPPRRERAPTPPKRAEPEPERPPEPEPREQPVAEPEPEEVAAPAPRLRTGEPRRGSGIQLMDPVYLPSTIDEYREGRDAPE